MKFDILEHAQSIGLDLVVALRAAEAAGRIIATRSGEMPHVESKDVGDLVSEVDIDADRAATDVLRREMPLPILSEELNSSQVESEHLWIVDPLDASTSFLMQAGPQYPSVLIALRRNRQTVLGVTFFPLVNEWFYAYRGRGAWKNARRLVCDSSESLSEVWVEMNAYGNAAWESDFFARLRNRLRSADGARLVTSNAPYSGVAARIATGEGTLAAAVHDNNGRKPKQEPWDVAAPQLILEEAGGVFLNPDGRRADPFRAEPIIAARSRSLAEQIIELGLTEPVRR